MSKTDDKMVTLICSVVKDDSIIELKKIKIHYKDVRAVYSGDRGCMCGCKGFYKYNPFHRESEGVRRGYEVNEDELGSTAIKRKMTKFSKLPAGTICTDVGSDYVYFDTETRTNVIYFNSNNK